MKMVYTALRWLDWPDSHILRCEFDDRDSPQEFQNCLGCIGLQTIKFNHEPAMSESVRTNTVDEIVNGCRASRRVDPGRGHFVLEVKDKEGWLGFFEHVV